MQIITFKGGYDNNFSYLIVDNKDCCLIDLTIPHTTILSYIKKHNLTLKFTIIMHSHFDHLVDIDKYNVPIYAHESYKNGTLKDNQILTFNNLNLKILHTPGHHPDCICIQTKNHLFTSDTLFINGCGRVDFKESDPEKQYLSLQRISNLPDHLLILPGHDYGPTPTATLKQQKQTNPYLNISKEEFLKRRT